MAPSNSRPILYIRIVEAQCRPLEMVDIREFRRKHIGYVFQKANLIPFLTALENVQIALEINDVHHKEARKRAIELFEPILSR